ncbi:MAG TPA: DUF5658 family protein [Anaerolineae bacterium]|nr:DUF5658 family protein [Anaerolineae bacterium]
MTILIIIFSILVVADFVTTYLGIRNGAREGSQWVMYLIDKSFILFVTVKVVLSIATVLLMVLLHAVVPFLAILNMILLCGWHLNIVYKNMWLILRV